MKFCINLRNYCKATSQPSQRLWFAHETSSYYVLNHLIALSWG